MTDWAKLGRNNKNRGRAFEKRFAALMGWVWVGTLRQTLQEGDVVDGFWKQDGFWVAECKTQQRGAKDNISVTDGYITQAYLSAARTGRLPVIAIHLVGLRDDYVFLPQVVAISLMDRIGSEPLKPDVRFTTVARGGGRGFVVQRSWMKSSKWDIAQVVVCEKGGDGIVGSWLMMRDFHFKSVLDEHDMHKPEKGDSTDAERDPGSTDRQGTEDAVSGGNRRSGAIRS